MLVLARKKGQTMMIGHDIEITVLDIQGDQVRLGINAPRSIAIHRKEIYDEIVNENISAVSSKGINISELNKIRKDKIQRKGEEEKEDK
ncbi:MAG: carbon storage regulator CsrA [Clostridiaceae bacterium]|nr:carbon storage regulator CsrA [Clostridiaceae bacterium]